MSSNIYSLKELGQASTSLKITQNHKKKCKEEFYCFKVHSGHPNYLNFGLCYFLVY